MVEKVKNAKMINMIIHEIRSRWIAILSWGIGLIIFGAVYMSIFPEVYGQIKSLDLSIFKLVGLHLASFEGYIASVILAYLSLLLGIYCIIISTSTLAGEEDNGILELIVALPLSRPQILTAKAFSLSMVALFILIIAGIGNAFVIAIAKIYIPINITPLNIFIALISSLPLLICIIMIGIFLGSILPNRRIATTVLAIYITVSYFVEHIAQTVKSIKLLKYFSLFNYYNTTKTIFTEGVLLSDIIILTVVAAVFYILSLIYFSKRNITVGAWPWQRDKITD